MLKKIQKITKIIPSIIDRYNKYKLSINQTKRIFETKRVRLLIKQALMQGFEKGWNKASDILSQRIESLQKEHIHELESISILYKNNLDIIKGDYNKSLDKIRKDFVEEIERLRNEFEGDRESERSDYQNEMSAYHKQYLERCNRNDSIRNEAIKQAESIKESALEAEKYWRSQIIQLNDFIAKTVSTVRTISDRYEYMQSSICKVTVGKDMIDELNGSFQKLIKDVDKNAPLLINTK